MVFKRLAAVFAALALIVGAVMLRQRLNDDSTATTASPSNETGQTAAPSTDQPILACVTDFAQICRAVDAARDDVTIQVEDWSDTAQAFLDGVGPDGWITLSPLATMSGFGASTPIASTDVVAAVRTDRVDVLTAACAAENLWLCVGKASGESWTEWGGPSSWGRVLPGFADPESSAIGALTFANANASVFEIEEFARVDIDASDVHADWFGRISRSVPAAALPDPLALLLQRASAVNIVATTSAAISTIPTARSTEVSVIEGLPAGRLDAVVAADDGSFDAASLAADIASGLTSTGWSAPRSGADGLPSAATVVLLRNLWQETRP